MTRHVSADMLARYREGDVSRRRAARIGTHLSGCASCASVSSGLAAVSSTLAAVRLPAIPEHLATRLSSALAAEAIARSAASPRAAGVPGTDPVPAGPSAPARIPGRPDLPERAGRSRSPRARSLRARWSSPLTLRLLAAAGAVVVVAGGGYAAVHQIDSGSGTSGSGTSGSAGHSNAGRSRPAAGRAFNSARAPAFTLPYRQNGTVHTASAIHSGFNFARATLAAQVRADISSVGITSLHHAAASSTPATGSPEPATPAPTAPTQPVPSGEQFDGVSVLTLEGCISLVAAGREVLLVDLARYQGEPATVIVTAESPAARTFLVAVVGRTCSASHSDIITSATVPAS
jgi:hypothetical protein